MKKVAYRYSGSNRYYTLEEYCNLLGSHVFVCHDLRKGIPFTDASADNIFSSHFLEHLSRSDGCQLLTECYRVLKPGGTLRVGVPDLEYALSVHGRGETERMLRNYTVVQDKVLERGG